MTERKVPLRRCAGCNEQKPKGEFWRVLRTPEGSVILDETGKKNGRGAYLCPKKSCLAKAKKSGRIARNLKVAIPEEIWAEMEERLEE